MSFGTIEEVREMDIEEALNEIDLRVCDLHWHSAYRGKAWP